MSGSSGPLESASDAAGGLDLDHEIDAAHVDAELQARGRHQGLELAGLEQLLDVGSAMVGDAAVVSEDQLLSCELVQALAQLLAQEPAVREEDRRAVSPDELQEPWVDGRPDALVVLALVSKVYRFGYRTLAGLWRAQSGALHVVDRDNDAQVEVRIL